MGHLKLTPIQILGRARGCIHDAYMGYELMTTDENAMHQLFGMRTIFTSGVMTTWALQKMRGVSSDFDVWYLPIQREMRADPLCKFFWNLRTQHEHEGMPHPIRATMEFLLKDEVIGTADVEVDVDLMGVRVDGWVDGAPMNRGPLNITVLRGAHRHRLTDFRFPDSPTTHMGETIPTDHFDYLSTLYINYLFDRLVIPAFQRYGFEQVQSTDLSGRQASDETGVVSDLTYRPIFRPLKAEDFQEPG